MTFHRSGHVRLPNPATEDGARPRVRQEDGGRGCTETATDVAVEGDDDGKPRLRAGGDDVGIDSR
ncbi:signal peptidase I [Sesbania bispinosa]|nr:signal peptidase I [Sesbania bispinosa]